MKTSFPYTPADIAELNHQADLLGREPMSKEEIDLLTALTVTPEDAEDRLGLVEDLAARCGLEINPSTRNRHRLRDAETNRNARADAPQLSAELLRKGFAIEHTGGGCYAWVRSAGPGLELRVTDAETPDLPTDTLPASLAVMSTKHGDPIAQTIHPTGLALADLLRAQ